MPIIPSFSETLEFLQGQLQAVLGNDSSFQIDDGQEAPFVDVLKLSSHPSEAERVGIAYVLLSGTDEQEPGWGLFARRVTITASARANEFAGAIEGVENPEAIQEKIARAITNFVIENRAAMGEEGVLNARARRGNNGTIDATKDSETVHFVDIIITFVYLSREE